MSDQPSRRKASTKVLISFASVVGIILSAGFAFQLLASQKDNAKRVAPEKPGLAVRTATITREDRTLSLSGWGRVEAVHQLEVKALRDGTLEFLQPGLEQGISLSAIQWKEPGVIARVETRELVIRKAEAAARKADLDAQIAGLDTREQSLKAREILIRASVLNAGQQVAATRAQEELAKADIASAEANLKRGQERLEDLRKLLATRDITEDEVQAQESQVDALKSTLAKTRNSLASIEVAVIAAASAHKAQEINLASNLADQHDIPHRKTQLEAQLELITQSLADLERQLNDASILNPWASSAGKNQIQVITRHVEAGDFVRRGDSVVTLLNTTQMRIRLKLPASRRADIGEQPRVRLRRSSDDQLLAEVSATRIAPVVDAATSTFDLLIDVDGTRLGLLPGDLVIGEVDAGVVSGALVLDRMAEVGDAVFVFRERDGSTIAERVLLSAYGVIREGEELLLVGGGEEGPLSAGDTLITSNLDIMVQGMKVRALEHKSKRKAYVAGDEASESEPGK